MHPTPTSGPQLTPISTVLTPSERLRVDAAGEGLYRTMHRESLDDVVRDVKERGASAVVVSVQRCDAPASQGLARIVREFPRVSTVALLSQVSERTPETMLSLGRSGVQRMIDVRDARGWRELRQVLMVSSIDDVQQLALGRIATDLAGAPPDCLRFFAFLFDCPPRVSTVRRLSRELDVLPSTLMSRFFRAGLPAPKRYLAMARLIRAARLFENRGFSVANVSNHLDYSSPQSFGRHVRTLLRLTAVEFRRSYDGAAMLEHFRAELVLPHLAALRQLTPLSAPPGWTPARRSGGASRRSADARTTRILPPPMH